VTRLLYKLWKDGKSELAEQPPSPSSSGPMFWLHNNHGILVLHLVNYDKVELRLHLCKSDVRELIQRLQNWVNTGSIKIAHDPENAT